MVKPVIAANKPIQVALEPGKEYYFCACGRSPSQPFCNGSHEGTGIEPRAFSVETGQEAFLCQCKHTGNSPFCDGTHERFGDDQVGREGTGT